eukprot:CAMPEP_0176064014 /NCGR_PEP_ID=MMETSP0120_2-20121206/31927_1 /TAXON_ID=160619 /ORGANISM="Kryptoperidinium foliaceum, Strain CCMP 1326" /LENGTH=136 /DNA_ID=CAMNT_0017397587 /DNA_START=277 /DNA_END=690 /DNA_ORIENTATION=-
MSTSISSAPVVVCTAVLGAVMLGAKASFFMQETVDDVNIILARCLWRAQAVLPEKRDIQVKQLDVELFLAACRLSVVNMVLVSGARVEGAHHSVLAFRVLRLVEALLFAILPDQVLDYVAFGGDLLIANAADGQEL